MIQGWRTGWVSSHSTYSSTPCAAVLQSSEPGPPALPDSLQVPRTGRGPGYTVSLSGPAVANLNVPAPVALCAGLLGSLARRISCRRAPPRSWAGGECGAVLSGCGGGVHGEHLELLGSILRDRAGPVVWEPRGAARGGAGPREERGGTQRACSLPSQAQSKVGGSVKS